jgi:hypothetical protein
MIRPDLALALVLGGTTLTVVICLAQHWLGNRASVLAARRSGRTVGWPKPEAGVIVGKKLLEDGVFESQRCAKDKLADWAATHGVTIRFADSVPHGAVGRSVGWCLVMPQASDYHIIFEAQSASAEELSAKIARRLKEQVDLLVAKRVSRVGVVTLYDPFSAGDITVDDSGLSSSIISAVNAEIRAIETAGVEVVELDVCLAHRATEFTNVIGGSFALNALGHGALVGLIQNWLVNGAGLTSEPGALYRQARGIPSTNSLGK